MSTKLATHEELRAYVQNPDLSDSAADVTLTAATGMVQAATGQTLVPVTGDEIELPAPAEPVLLPASRLTTNPIGLSRESIGSQYRTRTHGMAGYGPWGKQQYQ
jgi:hypothetical protein